MHPQVMLADQVLLLEKKPKVLGLTLDTQFTFTQHCKNIAVNVQQRNNLGCDKESLLTTYQAIGRLILNYCCPIWTPSPMDTKWSPLKCAQNSALRIATCCLEMADVAEMHLEARNIPVRQHNELISQKFALAYHLPQHPCHQLCHRPPGDRPDRRRSLIGRLKPNIQQYHAKEPLNITSYKSAISSIHQDAVRTAILSSSSKQLNGRQTPIATTEQTLPRKTRTILVQLRTRHS